MSVVDSLALQIVGHNQFQPEVGDPWGIVKDVELAKEAGNRLLCLSNWPAQPVCRRRARDGTSGLVDRLARERRAATALDQRLNRLLASHMLHGRRARQVHQDVRVHYEWSHQSYRESRRVASRGMGWPGGRLAIHSRSHAIFAAAVLESATVNPGAGSRRSITSSPHGSTVKRVPGGTTPAGTISAPWSSAWIVWPTRSSYRREVCQWTV
jgi:hypothetical protein